MHLLNFTGDCFIPLDSLTTSFSLTEQSDEYYLQQSLTKRMFHNFGDLLALLRINNSDGVVDIENHQKQALHSASLFQHTSLIATISA